MRTRATIEIKDKEGDTFYVYRGHGGTPENVLPDLARVIACLANPGFCSPEVAHSVTVLLGELCAPRQRVPTYEITYGWHEDESYRYKCHYDKELKVYVAGVIDAWQEEEKCL